MANRRAQPFLNPGHFYGILGLKNNATPEKIEEAYRKLAQDYHPDKYPDDPAAAKRYKEINNAYAILSDEKKKRIYDTSDIFGLQAAAMLGKDGENILASHNSCCIKFWTYCGLIATCGCCCFCCFCCCGLCLPKIDQTNETPTNIPTGGSSPVLRQPHYMHSETTPLNQEYDYGYSTLN
ncbi:dnaJ homolog subfamily C member 5-like isoform X2 [Stegostoma tigrinum]|nr:dnaJ homolog subfamily C member 5-like isoform X2 [Stegostoma tigrinum]